MGIYGGEVGIYGGEDGISPKPAMCGGLRKNEEEEGIYDSSAIRCALERGEGGE